MDLLKAVAFFPIFFPVIVSGKGFEEIIVYHVESTVFQSGSGMGHRSKIIRHEKLCSVSVSFQSCVLCCWNK